ncbi:MAG: L,D-transpeptidase [Byssovorax sp.]
MLLSAACSEQGAGDRAPASPPIGPIAPPGEPASPGPQASASAIGAPVASASASASASAAAGASPVASALPPVPPGPRIYAKARFVWIHPEARPGNGWIGYLSLGTSAALKGGSVESARTAGFGCGAWYAIEPRGYVCADDAATIDPDDPAVVALMRDRPRVDSPWPFEYGESTGAPRYDRLPTPEEQHKAEWDLDAHQQKIAKALATPGGPIDKELDGVDLSHASEPAPPSLYPFGPAVREARTWIAPGSTVAYNRSFELGGRTFLLSSDKMLIPKDRVKPYPRSLFHGVELGKDVSLPLAFFRKTAHPKYQRNADGSFVKTEQSWDRHAWVMLTGEEIKAGAQTFLPTREPGIFTLADDATVIRAATVAPAGKNDPALKDPGRRTWLDVSVLGGWLVAYEGLTPVFATLISPGRGGVPYEGHDPLETASTPTGVFRVDGKFVTATMVSSSNDLIVHTEVQYVQNFHGPHALHGAYWHDLWGEPKSGGCINLAPIDAKRVFEWTEPELPKDWYGMRSVADVGAVTAVWVHR